MNEGKLKDIPLVRIIIVTVLPLLLIYLPFLLHLTHLGFLNLRSSGMQQIYANWDGPNYVLNAITHYDPTEIGKRAFLARPNEYYAAHFPLYSWLMIPLAGLIGYFPSALVVNLASNIILNIVFYQWIKRHTAYPLWLTFVFTVFPPRYLIVRSVISPEMILVAFILSSLWKWERGLYLRAALLAVFAVLTKFQAIILMPVYIAVTLIQTVPHISAATCGWRQHVRSHLKLPMVVACLAPVFGYLLVSLYYGLTLGDPHAYFKAQNIVGMSASYPFGMFDYAARWVQTGWLEHTALYFVGMFVLIGHLWTTQTVLHTTDTPKQHPVYLIFAIAYTALLILIPQVDIMRLAMPLAPLFILSFHQFFTHRAFRIGLILSLPMLYLYVLNFIMWNQAPIADWGLFK